MKNPVFNNSVLAIILTGLSSSSALATGSESYHRAPIPAGTVINTPILSPVEQKIAAIRNEIKSLRAAKTARERNALLDRQAQNLDALELLLKGESPAATAPRLNTIEHRLERLETLVDQLNRR